ncbi:MAG TPA: alpha/beta fold hydrolase [Dongiaceae bacterium]|nr:alpha/beta fold hydrolase [Dongiaceae bacterium]
MASCSRIEILAFLFALIGIICTVFSSTVHAEDRLVPVNCWFSRQPGLTVGCFHFSVAEDRGAPGSKMLILPVVIVYAPQPDGEEPILYVPGGPGDSGWIDEAHINFWWNFIRESAWLRARDVILMDPRGTGMAAPLMDCSSLHIGDGELLGLGNDFTAINRSVAATNQSCLKELTHQGFAITQYRSRVMVEDLHELLAALHRPKWNLYGLSYGTRVALTYMRRYPEDLRSVILDSVLPPEVKFSEDSAWVLNRALETFFSGCARSARCRKHGDMRALVTMLFREWNAHPFQRMMKDPYYDHDFMLKLTGNDIINYIIGRLYNRSDIEELPKDLADIAGGAPKAHERLAETLLNDTVRSPAFGDAAGQSVFCLEEWPSNDSARARANFEKYPLLADASKFEDGCKSWVIGQNDPEESQAVESDIPALVLAGHYDPVTPPEYARLAVARLHHAYYFEFPGAGHDVLSNEPCGDVLAEKFLHDLETPPTDACLGKVKEPDFQ